MVSRVSTCCDGFMSYNSVRLAVMRNPKLGAVNRVVQLLVVVCPLLVLLGDRQYMVKETPLGAQDIYGEVEQHGSVVPLVAGVVPAPLLIPHAHVHPRRMHACPACTCAHTPTQSHVAAKLLQ